MNVAEEYLSEFKGLLPDRYNAEELIKGNFPTPMEIINDLIGSIKDIGGEYVEILLLFAAVILLTVLIQSTSSDLTGPVNIAAGAVVVLAVVKSSFFNFETLLGGIEESVVFVRAFIPIFATVTALSGKISLSGVYGALALFCVEAFSEINVLLLKPFINIMISTGALSFVRGGEKFLAVCEGIKKMIIGILCAMSAIILGIMSLNGFVANGTDSMIYKASKLVSGAAIPVIGGTLSGSFETVTACFTAASGVVGAAGIFVIIALALPTLLKVSLFILTNTAAEFLCVFFENDSLKRVFSSFRSVGVLILSSYFFELLVLVIGISVMLLLK